MNQIQNINPNSNNIIQQKDKKYQQLELELKIKNSRDLFTNTGLDSSDAIFNHIFINQQGDNEIPGSTRNLYFDGFNNKFILPVESNNPILMVYTRLII